MAITLDDLPGISQQPSAASLDVINARLLATLRIERVPAVGFVNERGIDIEGERGARTAILGRWLDARMELGNHTYSHPDLNTMPPEPYQVDVLKGELITRKLMSDRGQALHWFRHPFTHTGPTAAIKAQIDGFLGAHGYTVAPFTIETADYVFAVIYERAALANDEASADKVMAAYLTRTRGARGFLRVAGERHVRARDSAGAAHSREPAQRRRDAGAAATTKGPRVSWVPLGEALKDEAYATRDDYVGRIGPSWLHRWRVALGKPDRLRDEPDPPQWVMKAFSEQQ